MYWQPINYKNKKIVRNYADGINTYVEPFDIKDSELTDAFNVCANDYPAIRTRNDRQALTNVSITGQIRAWGKRNADVLDGPGLFDDALHLLEENTWKYSKLDDVASTAWTVVSTSMAIASGEFIEFNTEAKRFTILLNPTTSKQQFYAYDGTTTLVGLTTDAPNSYLYTVHRFRVFGVEDDYKTIKYSAIGTCTDWTSTPGTNSGSFVLTQVKDKITAITTYQDHVIIWTANSMHELYGYEPLNFVLQDISMEVGGIKYAEINGKLYFVNGNGVYLYTGGLPKLISQKADKIFKTGSLSNNPQWDTIKSIVPYNNKLYFMFPYNVWYYTKIIVYDTEKDIWFTENAISNTDSYAGIGNFLYNNKYKAIAIPLTYSTAPQYNYVVDLDSGYKTGYDYLGTNTEITSYFISKAYNEFELDKEISVRDIALKYSGSTVATMNIQYSTDAYSTTFNTLIPSTMITFTTTEAQRDIYPIQTTDLNQCAHYRIKFNNTGHVKVNGLQTNYISYGGDL